MSIQTQTIFEAGMKYLEQGYSIIPVGKDKRPLLKSWKEFQSRVPTEDELLQWLKEFPEANIAIVSGRVSNVTLVDIDTKGGQAQADEILKKFPVTFTVQTPSLGYHLYYLY